MPRYSYTVEGFRYSYSNLRDAKQWAKSSYSHGRKVTILRREVGSFEKKYIEYTIRKSRNL